jgi:hypothetical protein
MPNKKQFLQSPRRDGKNFQTFLWLCETIRLKKTSEIHHPNYVVMSRERYNELIKKAYPSKCEIVFDELNTK